MLRFRTRSPNEGMPETATAAPPAATSADQRTLAWVGPFAVFIGWLAINMHIPVANPAKEIVRDIVILASIVGFSRRVIPTRAPHWMASILVGLAAFALWVAPDVLMPGWRSHWAFQNVIMGRISPSITPQELTPLMLGLRTVRAALLVPVLEELFWRGWLPRWVQDNRFYRVPLGQYTQFAFWATALLFAAEHGPYWEVGLLCGILYNLWMRHTRSLGDLILVHGVTNLALSLYVVGTQDWRFWL